MATNKSKYSAYARLFSILALMVFTISCETSDEYDATVTSNPEYYHRSMKQLTDVIVYDIFSPPVASRIYAYPNIAAYETIINAYPEYPSLAGEIHGLSPAPQPASDQQYDFHVAALQAFLKVGKAMVFSEDKMDAYIETLYKNLKSSGIPDEIFQRSIKYGDSVGAHILAWADKDNYKQTRTFPKFTINSDEKARWQPTPPAYMDAIEPHWNKIRTLVLDSANQFVPPPPTPYDMEKTSKFYDEVLEVYETGKNLTDEQKEIAQFWDCNPYVSHVQGHLMFATKKITPGGHWMGISSIASRQTNANYPKSIQTYAYVAISLMDAFISCWDEKYRSELIRPETVINQHLDESWVPLLQTPPFPEYTSGHSVISTAAATTLTKLYGNDFHFMDTTEVEYGMKPREFDSFIEASQEAAISRLYGGIHYMPACSLGVEQGKKVGQFIVNNLPFKEESESAETEENAETAAKPKEKENSSSS